MTRTRPDRAAIVATVTQRIRELRIREELYQDELARRISHGNQRCISYLETGGRHDIGIGELYEIAYALGVTVQDILEGVS